MRVLLDENMDRRIRRFFGEEHEILTVQECGWAGGWAGKKNGELLGSRKKASTPSSPRTGTCHATGNAIEDLTPLMERVNAALEHPEPGVASRISDR